MPLRKDSKRRSDPADFDSVHTMDTSSVAATADRRQEGDQDEEDEDETQDAWLESLGVDNSEIRKINNSQVRPFWRNVMWIVVNLF